MNNNNNRFNNPSLHSPSRLNRFVTWTFILLHLWSCVFPVHFAYAAKPITVSALKEGALQTKGYTLQFGEDAVSVASKYNTSLSLLKLLNQHRQFKQGFELIGEGDEINVPITPLKGNELYGGETSEAGSQSNTASTLATLSAQAGQFLSNNPNGEKTEQLARTLAAGYLGGVAERTLSPYGNARITLDVDKNFSLKNSQAELLFPFLDREHIFGFFQGALHRTESRNQSNLGSGVRYFGSGYMLGANTFFDYDLSRHHSRLGIGLEYWRDYLKLSANGYFRLTNWKHSVDLDNHDERPANGWDIRTEGYFPVYPQLGCKLIFEQYYGKEVGLLGKDNRQSDPRAFTVGVSYTPMPLITLETEHRRGKNSNYDTRFGLQLNYHFGVPWSSQLSHKSVADLRRLDHNRYDFVSRNNHIVLEYREHNLLTIALPEEIIGEATKTLPVTLIVKKGKHGLKEVEWSSPDLIASNGKIEVISPTLIHLTVPPSLISIEESEYAPEVYQVQAVATDLNGNKSNKAVMTIRVMPFDTNKTHIDTVSLEDTEDSKPADGQTNFIFTAHVFDPEGNPIKQPGIPVYWSHDKGDKAILSATKSVTNDQGEASILLISTTNVVSDIQVSAQLSHSEPVKADKLVNFVANPDAATITSVTLNGDVTHKVADGSNTFDFTATVSDQNGNPVRGLTINASTNQDNTAVPITVNGETDDNGQVIVTLTNTRKALRDIIVSAKIGEQAAVDADKMVSFTADEASAVVRAIQLVSRRTSQVANGSNTFDYLVAVTDENGNPVEGATVTPSTNQGDTVSVAAEGKTEDDGITVVTLKSTTQVTLNIVVSARVGSTAAKSAEEAVNFVADSNAALVTDITLDDPSITSKVADGKNSFTYTVTVVDKNGNPVEGMTIEPSSNKNAGEVVITAPGTTDAKGQLKLTLTSTTKAVDEILVGAKVTDTDATKSATTAVSFIADSATAKVATFALTDTFTSKAANGTNYFSYTVTVLDQHANPVPDMAVTATVNSEAEGKVIVAAPNKTDGAGLATVTLTSTTRAVAAVMVSAQVGSTAALDADKRVNFTADTNAARITSVILTDSTTSKVANGKNSFSYRVKVTDPYGNPIAGITVNALTNKPTDAAVIAVLGPTDASGVATITVTSTTRAVAGIVVSASLNGTETVESDKPVNFTADERTAHVTALTLDGDETTHVADGKTQFSYSVRVLDENNNPVPGVAVTPSVNSEAESKVNVKANGNTNENGQATLVLTSTTQAIAEVMVSAAVGTTPKIDADQTVNFTADRLSAKITGVVLNDETTSKVADGKNSFSYTVTVRDKYDNPVDGTLVMASTTHPNQVSITPSGTTDTSGQVILTLTSSQVASNIIVKAQLGETDPVSATQPVNFIADEQAAKVTTVTLNDNTTSKVADGQNSFSYTVSVVDQYDNPVTGVTVSPLSNKSTADVLLLVSGPTNEQGLATITLRSTTKVAADIRVSAKIGTTAAIAADKAVNFTADSSTAKVMTVKLDDSVITKIADGQSRFSYTVTVLDKNSNPVENMMVDAFTNQSVSDTVISVDSKTNALGQTKVTLTSTTKAMSGIIVSAQVTETNDAKEADTAVNFIADVASATVTNVKLIGALTSQIADGKNSFAYTVTVTDRNSNPVSGVVVTPSANTSADKAAVSVDGETNASGEATLTLTSTKTAVADIIVSAAAPNSDVTKQADKSVSFVANAESARVTALTLDGSVTSQIADGKNSFTFTVTVSDQHGNPVEDITVVPTTDKKAKEASIAVNGKTNANGQTTLTLTSTTKASLNIVVSAEVPNSAVSKNADKLVSFVADRNSVHVREVLLLGELTSKVANGFSSFCYFVVVTDKNGNPLEGIILTTATNKSAEEVTLSTSEPTDEKGITLITLTSTKKAVSGVMVSARVGSGTAANADKTVNFAADWTSAKVKKVTLNGDLTTKVATVSNSFDYTVKVVDKNDNPVPNIDVTALVNREAEDRVSIKMISITNEQGNAIVTITSTGKAIADVLVSAKVGTTVPQEADQNVNFIADSGTARVMSLLLNGDLVSQVADGYSQFVYTATVVDQNGNPVPEIDVIASVNSEARDKVNASTVEKTDKNGRAKVILTSTIYAFSGIEANARVGNTTPQKANKKVNFVADSGTASVDSVKLVDEGTTNKVADGINSFKYIITVVDQNKNPVEGVRVESFTNKNANEVSVKAEKTTNKQGQVEMYVISTTKAIAKIVASAKVAETDDDKSSTSVVNFIADQDSAKVSSLTLQGSLMEKVADGMNHFRYTATVVDRNNNPVPAMLVSATLDENEQYKVNVEVKGKTSELGKVDIILISTTKMALNITLKAQVTGNGLVTDADHSVSFTADCGSAKIRQVKLVDDTTSKLADGQNTFTYIASIVDRYNNPVIDIDVAAFTNKNAGEVFVEPLRKTDKDGLTHIVLKSTKTAVTGIILSVKMGSAEKVDADSQVAFIADLSSAKVSSLTLIDGTTNKVANGSNKFSYLVTVHDQYNNPVMGAQILATQDKDDLNIELENNGLSNEQGEVSLVLVGGTKATLNIMVSAKVGTTDAMNADKRVSFTADRTSAKVATIALNDKLETKLADAINQFIYTITVVDKYGNPVPGMVIAASVNPEAIGKVRIQTTGKTDAEGQTQAIVTSTKSAVSGVILSAKVQNTEPVSIDKPVNFISDIATAKVTSVTLDASTVRLPANGIDKFTYTVSVADKNKNPVEGVEVTVSTNKNDDGLSAAVLGRTDEKGHVKVTLVSTKALTNIVLSAQFDKTTAIRSARSVSFDPDKRTAHVTSVLLDEGVTFKVANGTNTFGYTVIVRDKHNNYVPNTKIIADFTMGDIGQRSSLTLLAANNGLTNAVGEVRLLLGSEPKVARDIIVNAKVENSETVNANMAVHFTANNEQSFINNINVDRDRQAVGKPVKMTITLVDDLGNLADDRKITLSANPSLPFYASDELTDPIDAVFTDVNGVATVYTTALEAQVYQIKAQSQQSTKDQNNVVEVIFLADK